MTEEQAGPLATLEAQLDLLRTIHHERVKDGRSATADGSRIHDIYIALLEAHIALLEVHIEEQDARIDELKTLVASEARNGGAKGMTPEGI